MENSLKPDLQLAQNPEATPRPALEVADELPHSLPDVAQTIIVAGRRGQGKTTFMRRYLSSREPRVLSLDAFGDFKPAITASSMDEAFHLLADGSPRRVRLEPAIQLTPDGLISTREYGELFFARCFMELRNCLIGLDEISLWSRYQATPSLEALVLQGRRRGLRMLTACQRLQRVPDIMLSEGTDLITFRTRRPRDIAVLKEWGGEEVAEESKSLAVGECLHIEL